MTFTGALKRRGELQTLSFEIPTLASSDKVCQALERLREQLPDAADLTPQQVNARYGQVVAKVCDRISNQMQQRAKEFEQFTAFTSSSK